ncbi:MAG TPA: hypothetical protein VNU68_35105 [Verrucomicrobiae bacterium]|nr:hypothetical protein [Verrucomicrobiae bacterium]
MTVQVVQLFPPTTLTTTAATLYTVTTVPTQILLARGRIRFTNTDTVSRAVTAYGIPSGGAATVTNTFCPALVVAPNSVLDVDVPVLAAGGFIQAKIDSGSAVEASALDGILFS